MLALQPQCIKIQLCVFLYASYEDIKGLFKGFHCIAVKCSDKLIS